MWRSDIKWHSGLCYGGWLDMFFCWKCHSNRYRPVSICGGRRREITARLDWFERLYLYSEKHRDSYTTSAGFRHIEARRRHHFIWSLCLPTQLGGFVLFGRRVVGNNIIAVTFVSALQKNKKPKNCILCCFTKPLNKRCCLEIRWNEFICIEKLWNYTIHLADSVTCFVDRFLPFMNTQTTGLSSHYSM